MTTNFHQYLSPTFFLDFKEPDVITFAEAHCQKGSTNMLKAVALYYAVRDKIKYDPFAIEESRTFLKASSVLKKQTGYCVAKAVLLAALCRQQNIPARLGFADVTNHLSTTKLREQMGTDLFIYHGYTDIYLQDKWVKATPAFNLSLCTRFNVRPLEFDGTEDSIFHESNTLGQKHMEYVRDRGHFTDVPYDELFAAMYKTYPRLYEKNNGITWQKFEEDAENEAPK